MHKLDTKNELLKENRELKCQVDRLKQELQDRDSRYFDLNKLFVLSPDMLCVASIEGYFTRVNPAFTRLLGYSESHLLELPFLDFVHPDDRGKTLGALHELASENIVVEFENRYRCKNGKFKWLEWNALPV